jgi:glyoxylase-like metal-dependent hydrolase (beta-lactamase superfamily II)
MAATDAPLIVGEARIHRVEEVTYKFPLSMFTADEALIERHWDWLFPRFSDADRNWDMVVQSWIAVVDDKVIVVDPCVGNGRSFPEFPIFHMLDTPFIERFAETGFRPEDVTHVFCTHLHSDHCGWNTRLRDGRWVPTFPNARYVLVRREVERWDPSRPGYDPDELHNRLNAGVFEASVRPVIEAGLAELVDDTHRIGDGLLIEPTHGHTLGHSSLTLSSGAAEACFAGDLFHHPIELFHPEIDANTCERYPTTVESRRRVIARCLARDTLLIPGHFANPGAGYLRGTAEAMRFEPYGCGAEAGG